uniref:Peroxisomal membrane protein PEX16 n=1 Tax=Lygus hesperus TaxID=30085 RepID=A0A0K8TIE4_LYGHE
MSSIQKDFAHRVETTVQKYCTWLARNPGLSKEVELGVKLSSYLLVHLVDRGDASDATHQMVYCLSDLFSFLNDIAISRAYPRAKLPYGNNLKTWLTVVEYCEVCFELGAQKAWGTSGKWTTVFLVQVFKCVARVLLVTRKNEGLLPFPPIVPLRREAVGEYELMGDGRSDLTYTLGSGVVIRRIDGGPSYNQMAQGAGEDFRTLVKENGTYVFKGSALLGEILYCVKPLIHLATMRFAGRNNWAQWFTSLALEGASLRLQWSEYSKRRFTPEQEWQYVSRLVSILVYLVRSPFYDLHVKSMILSVLLGLRKIFPFMKFVLNPCIEFLPAWHETYFYLWSH